MCGIVGAVSAGDVTPFLLNGLNTLEYRGYDSAGLALLNDGLRRARAVGRVSELESLVAQDALAGRLGIAHTRWATHGVPAERNAHPHVSGGLAVVHNGIIENYGELREQLKALGYEFTSDTDTETIAHLIQAYLESKLGSSSNSLFGAVREAVKHLKGAFALAVIREDEPDTLVLAREGSPLMLGIGNDGYFAASDASALVGETRRLMYLENGDVAQMTRQAVTIVDGSGRAVEREEVISTIAADAVQLGEFNHYMQKEIFEQPQALGNTLEMLGGVEGVQAGLLGADAEQTLDLVDSVLILACGTSSYAGMVARYWVEAIASIPCSVEIASEYRYRQSVPNERQLIVVISQ